MTGNASPPVSDGEDIEKLLGALIAAADEYHCAFHSLGSNPDVLGLARKLVAARKAVADAFSQAHQLRLAAEQERESLTKRMIADGQAHTTRDLSWLRRICDVVPAASVASTLSVGIQAALNEIASLRESLAAAEERASRAEQDREQFRERLATVCGKLMLAEQQLATRSE